MKRYKYPRTHHLPWSPGATSDDRMHSDEDVEEMFEGRTVVVTAKMDGENTTMYSDYMHARSLEFESHPSRNQLRAFHGSMRHLIPKGYRVCGENLFAKHSIHYRNLPALFLVFSIWAGDTCLSWDQTLEWAELLGLSVVPELYHGLWSAKKIKALYASQHEGDVMEGYVVRVADAFKYDEFSCSMAKYVRAGHVTTDTHWKSQAIVPNRVKKP